ncbi:MAG: hypothetical protein J4F29_08970 [Candidatus Latescibacteria bacterium]|nr:hypothetical protein [Candidatus Latescibacterota bacterium]
MNRLLICLLFVCFAVACGSSDKSLQPGETITLSEGDILLTDAAQRALFRIHPTSGDRTVVSNRIGGVPRQIARDTNGDLLMTLSESSLPVVLRFAIQTGELFIVSSGGSLVDPNVPVIGSGPPFLGPVGLVRETSGQLIVGDQPSATIFRVDPNSGDRAVVSGPGRGDGPPFTGRIKQFALEADGNLLLVVGSVSQGGEGRIFRIDPTNGDRMVVSGPEMGEGPRLMDPEGIVLNSLNTIFVTDIGQAAVIQIDPISGNRTVILSPFMGDGETPDIPSGLAFNILDELLVADRTVIYRVDISTGDRTVISAPIIGQGEPFLVADDIFVIKN